MAKTEIPRNIKWINAIILVTMATATIWAVSPWSAWRGDPASHGYGWNRFSYFTVQSNFIATATYLIAAFAIISRKQLGGWFRYFRGAAVLYMVVTGIVYALLLQPNPEVNLIPIFLIGIILSCTSSVPSLLFAGGYYGHPVNRFLQVNHYYGSSFPYYGLFIHSYGPLLLIGIPIHFLIRPKQAAPEV